ncbi:MAG: hypothetical protein U0936_28075 [Planctomycetaceae bacterium]
MKFATQPVVYATLIVVLVVFPLFSMAGLEGRMFPPLGVAYASVVTRFAGRVADNHAGAGFVLAPQGRFLEKGDPFVLPRFEVCHVKPCCGGHCCTRISCSAGQSR